MKLLLVEDNRELASWLRRLLNQSGYAVEQAYSGEEAATLLLTQQYDAILLDLTLPGIQGQVILKGLRRKDDQTPVLIISREKARSMTEKTIAFNEAWAEIPEERRAIIPPT